MRTVNHGISPGQAWGSRRRIVYWIAYWIVFWIAYRIDYTIAYRIRMPWGRLLDVIFMLSGYLLGIFWTPFGCLLGAFWVPFRDRDSHWGNFHESPEILWKRIIEGQFFWDPFLCDFHTLGDFLAVCFYMFFGLTNFRSFSKLFEILGSMWVPFGVLFGGPGNFENGARTLTRVRFSHSGPPFSGLNSRLEFAFDFSGLFALLGIFVFHLERLLAPFGWNDLSNIIVQKKVEKRGCGESR